MVATHNPFRTPTVTPTPTGRTSSSSPPLPPVPQNNNVSSPLSYAPPPRSPSERIQTPSTAPEATGGSVADILAEELPPAYTAAPNIREGESTLELGPRRPFQQSTPISSRQQPQFPPEQWGVSAQQSPDSSWTSFPGSLHRSQTGTQRTGLLPPPQHPAQRSQSTRVRRNSHPTAPDSAASDFARDFYAAGADDSGLYGGSSAQYQSSSAGTSPTSHSSVSSGFPAGPDRLNTAKHNASSSTENGVPDDGRPTDRPVPGHPLLRHGKVLVYPQGYECQKCRNTGYKNYDPSHPCSRCWERYARPYAGAITYASWNTDGQSASSSPSSAFQRPLPVFRPPQSSLHNHSASWAGPPSANTNTYGGGYPGASTRVLPIAGGILPMSSYLDRLGTGVRTRTGIPPPPAQLSGVPASSGPVVVYPPGDSRIGGRLCWRCGGSGKTSFLIFDESTCGICDGVGRTFV